MAPRLVQFIPPHQVDPDVVVRIAELGIDPDGAETLLEGDIILTNDVAR